MQENIAYNAVQKRNLTSGDIVYEMPNASQRDARKVEPVARKKKDLVGNLPTLLLNLLSCWLH